MEDEVTPAEPESHRGEAAAAEPGAPPYPAIEELAAMLPAYEIHGVIGVGGMGAVYLGRQAALDRWVAIKLLPAAAAGSAHAAQQFIQEARAMAKLAHPHIVAVFDFGQTADGHLYLVMEYVDGEDLHRRIHAGLVTPERARTVAVQLCDALQFAHARGVVHRDVKPANILLTRDWQVKVADFGLAREMAAIAGGDGAEYGTPDYTAPERLTAGAAADHRADVYAVGVVMHEMLTGKTPRRAGAHAGRHLPDAFAGVISKCRMHDPERRYQSAAEVRQALLEALSLPAAGKAAPAPRAMRRLPQTVAADEPEPPPTRRASPFLEAVGWGLGCLALVVLAGWFVLHRLKSDAAADAADSEPPIEAAR